MQRGRRWMWLS